MKTISRLFDRAKRLGGNEEEQDICSPFAGLMGSGKQGCSYWTQERLKAFAVTHPPDPDRPKGAFHVLMTGCPFLDESDWGGLGSGKYDEDGMLLPSPERPCAGCEFLIPATKEDKQD